MDRLNALKLNQLVEVAQRGEVAAAGLCLTCLAEAHPHREEIEPCYRKTDRDYGTPPKSSAKLVTLEVDGREVTVPRELRCARRGARRRRDS